LSGGEQKTLYYPDWQAFFNYPDRLEQKNLLPTGAKRSDQDGGQIGDDAPGTVAVVQHIAHNRKDENDLRGWPLGTVSGPYQRAHKQFMEGRMAVSVAKQMYVQRMQVSAGSRGLASIKSTLQSSLASSGWSDTNPPAPPGGTQLTNQGVTTTDLPMTTGASDAKSDNEMFSWQALLGDGLFPTSAGLDTSRFATALTMDKNQAMLWARYKSFIAQQFKDMVRIVLLFQEKYNNATFQDKSASVVIDTLSVVDFPPVVTAMSEMFDRALTPLVVEGVIPTETARRIAAASWAILLQALGVEGVGELTNEEAFGVGVENEPPPTRGPAFERDLVDQQARAIAARDVALEQAAEAIRAAAERLG